ncbi:hypothetical protein HAX54_001708 [Datura stramonium]|uniref:Uncharacterized protein n=1 Tax=Datura stramonium TaxID=4076 RepID=A0ABS8T2S7_DATST|nr:hypothetical protein [Datura stramonium]
MGNRFLQSSRIPWHKVVSAKKYMYCYDNVVKWDDSAGQKLNDAKRRYWAEISGLPSQSPPPNPDVYIDRVDWDSNIDPELILDLDREYFNPNEVENSVKSENNLDFWMHPGLKLVIMVKILGKVVMCRDSKTFEDGGQTWNEWDNPVTSTSWERNFPKTQGTLKDTGEAVEMSGRSESVSGTKDEWTNNRIGSWGRNRWNTRGHEQRNSRCSSVGIGTLVEVVEQPQGRRWGESEFTSWDWQRQPRQSNERNVDFGRPSRGDKTFYTGSRKEEGSSQHMSRYKSSRFQDVSADQDPDVTVPCIHLDLISEVQAEYSGINLLLSDCCV